MCGGLGLDLAHDLIPVGPAAHYIMGGVDTDEWGRTSLPGLFAAGEAACTGVHGANRLASNSLLEGLVFGARSAVAMQEEPRAAALKRDRVVAARINPRVPSTAGARGFSRAIPEIRDLMWRRAGLFRTREGLAEAVDVLEDVAVPDGSTTESCRLRNLLTIARLIARAALRREESRGGHFRQDFPNRDDIHWKVHFTDCADL
jgi:L-aspartate oxidase